MAKKEEEANSVQDRGHSEDQKGLYKVSNFNSPLHLDMANIDLALTMYQPLLEALSIFSFNPHGLKLLSSPFCR